MERLVDWGCGWLGWSLDAVLAASPHVIEHVYRAHVEYLEMTNEMWARSRAKNGPAMPRKPRAADDDGVEGFVRMLEAHPLYAAGGGAA